MKLTNSLPGNIAYCITGLVLATILSGAGCGLNSREDSQAERTSAELAVSWNEMVIGMAIEEDKLLTLKGVRALSMMHVAMHDALNAVDRRYASYAYEANTPDTHPIAAAAQAAYEVAVHEYPDRQEVLAEKLDHWLSTIEDGPAKTKGVALGRASAEAILAKREGDHYDADAEYTIHPMAPGVYAEFPEHSNTPEGFVFGAGWAEAEPFMLTDQDQFRAPPPPEINSDAYTRAFNDVKTVGRYQSTTRTADQTHLAMWWKDFIENSHNRLARQLTLDENLDLWTAARMFALLNMSIYDGYVSVFDNKFFYNHWRPFTAIRWAANDGNPDTVPDTSWNNLHRHTYAFPSYPSAHGTVSASAMTILEGVLGEDYAFTMTTEKVDKGGPFSGKVKMEPPTRSFESFVDAAKEAAASRVYLGIHFRYDSDEGFKLGRRVGQYARSNYLTPVG